MMTGSTFKGCVDNFAQLFGIARNSCRNPHLPSRLLSNFFYEEVIHSSKQDLVLFLKKTKTKTVKDALKLHISRFKTCVPDL